MNAGMINSKVKTKRFQSTGGCKCLLFNVWKKTQTRKVKRNQEKLKGGSILR
jgi:hypothetical protein